MEKKNTVNIKTFEEFKSDNANHYAYVLGEFRNMLAYLKSKPVEWDSTPYKMAMAGDWKVEYPKYPRIGDDNEFMFHHKDGAQSIHVETTITHATNPEDVEFEDDNVEVDSVTYILDDGSTEFVIAVTAEIETVLEYIIAYSVPVHGR